MAASAAVLYALREVIAPAYGAILVGVVAGAAIVGLGLMAPLLVWMRRPSGVDDAGLATN